MQLAANLTLGWEDIPRSQFSALELHNRAIAAPHYEKNLLHQLQSASGSIRILGVDQLFRQALGGSRAIRQFVSALAHLPALPQLPSPLPCDIDLFAYAYLVGAQSFDLLLPIVNANDITLAQIQIDCAEALHALEDFEASGSLPKAMSELDAQQYLGLRKVICRPSAQRELKILATLMISGPSRASDLMREQGMDYALGQQILDLFESLGIVTRWGEEPGSYAEEPTYVIEKVAIPLVVFCLRETLGLDLLSNLSALLDATYG